MSKNNSLAPLATLFESRQEQLFVAAIAITRDRAAAEDAVLDALLAVSQLEQAPDNLLAYVFRTVRNKALHSKQQAQRFTAETDFDEFIDTRSQTPEQQIFLRQILAHLDKLESNQQQVLIMKLFGDLSFQEIAEVTANNPNTVASWYRRGLAQLKESLHEPAL